MTAYCRNKEGEIAFEGALVDTSGYSEGDIVTIKVDARKRIEMKKSPYELTDDQKKAMKEEIHAYFLDERDEDIGIILQEGLLDLFMDRLAPIVYNKALDDAKMWFSRRMDDVETDFYELYKNEQ